MAFIYRNKTTGVEITVPCDLNGTDWELVCEIGNEKKPILNESEKEKPVEKKIKKTIKKK